jgi:hypothetical protein
MPSTATCRHPTLIRPCFPLKSGVWFWLATEAANFHLASDFAKQQIGIGVIYQHKPAFIRWLQDLRRSPSTFGRPPVVGVPQDASRIFPADRWSS